MQASGCQRLPEPVISRLMAVLQSTRPHGARHAHLNLGKGMGLFQSTRPHGARPTFPATVRAGDKFQSTRPHGARPPRARPREAWAPVSIHAPARGATAKRADAVRVLYVSIHAPARGATRKCSPPRSARRFNPRARTGRDAHGRICWGQGVGFNPRARTGRDWAETSGKRCLWMFQSTRPHGARLRVLDADDLALFVSIHAPARGATRWVCRRSPRVSFNPRARTGRDPGRRPRGPAPRCFNPRARTGRDVAFTRALRDVA